MRAQGIQKCRDEKGRLVEAEMKQNVAKARDYRKGGRPGNRLQIVIAYIVMDDFLRRDVEDRAEGEPRHRKEEREPQERRHRGELLRLERTPQQFQGDNAAGAECRNSQESPGKPRIDRGEKVGDLQARNQDCVAKPGRSKERACDFPLPESSRTQKPEVKTAGKMN